MLSKIKEKVAARFTGGTKVAFNGADLFDWCNVEYDSPIKDVIETAGYMKEYSISLSFTQRGFCNTAKELEIIRNTFFIMLARDFYGDVIEQLYSIMQKAYDGDTHKSIDLIAQLIKDLEKGSTMPRGGEM